MRCQEHFGDLGEGGPGEVEAQTVLRKFGLAGDISRERKNCLVPGLIRVVALCCTVQLCHHHRGRRRCQNQKGLHSPYPWVYFILEVLLETEGLQEVLTFESLRWRLIRVGLIGLTVRQVLPFLNLIVSIHWGLTKTGCVGPRSGQDLAVII
jgi:hypothetical protein